MAWIKRNLFFAVGLGVALLLLAAAAVYDLQSLSHNTKANDKLNEIYGTLKQVGGGMDGYSWGSEKINNIQAARTQTAQIQSWMKKSGDYFQPITPIPNSPNLTSADFANELRRTISDLQHEAANASITLPPDYSFSFTEQRSTTKFSPGSLEPLARQVGEVKTISEILFAAHVNALDSVQRVRVSEDDAAGQQADYINELPTTNSLAVLTPYAVTFRSFSAELATVLAGFAASSHGFIVTGINVAPAGQAAQAVAGPGGYGGYGGPVVPGGYGNYVTPPLAPASTPAPVPGRGGLPTVLNEQMLRITLEVEVVKIAPGT